jgi:hypothetical protein
MAIGVGLAPLVIAGCGSHADQSPSTPEPAHHGSQTGSPGLGSQNGHWDDNGRPVSGGPAGADGSTGNNFTQEYCARNENPACPIGSYVGPDAIPNPNGSNGYVPCEGTTCTNSNHGAGDDPEDQRPSGGN